ncbi:MAG: tyrosine protein kinase [Candidatus Binatia bacterium]|nr:MAG: tyrosine protein kinase [Candidatus Binatia bacterium]
MSKIYEALKKAEQEREQSRSPALPRISPASPPKLPAVEEEYRKLRANLLTAAGLTGVRTILVTSPGHGEGATTVSLGLARALGKEKDSRVLLVEANLRTPALHRTLALPPDCGFARLLAGDGDEERATVRVEGLGFSVLPVGGSLEAAPRPDDLEVLGDLVGKLRGRFDFVVIDGAPVNLYADTSLLAPKADGVILVVEADRTPVAEADAAKRQLERVGARLLGAVLNRKRTYIPAFLEVLL